MVSAGADHTCVLTTAGAAKCWGNNDHGQLGDGTSASRSTPVDVRGLTPGAISIEASSRSTCAVTALGAIKCWGFNILGQLGDGTTTARSTPVDVIGLTAGVIAVESDGGRACALTKQGGTRCWGRFWLGDGTNSDRSTPVDVNGLD